MKKSFIIILAIVMIFAFSGLAIADSSSDAPADTQVRIEDNRIIKSINTRQHVTLIPIPLPNSLPPIYKNGGWEVWRDPFFTQNPVTMQMMKAMRRPGCKQYINHWCKLEQNDAPVETLTKWPTREKFATREDGKSWKIIGMVTSRGRTEANVEEAIFEAMFHAKKVMNVKRVIVLIRKQLVTTGKVLALGTVIGANGMYIHHGSTDGLAAGVAGGSGWGSTDSWIDERPFIKVICFN